MKKSLLVDVDGVLADYTKGFQSIDVIGDPIEGAVKFTHDLSEFARVVIYTTRVKEYPKSEMERDGRSLGELVAIVKAWLDKHDFYYDEIYVGQGKPFCAGIIDDRAISCRPQSPWVSQLDQQDPRPYTQALWTARNLCED